MQISFTRVNGCQWIPNGLASSNDYGGPSVPWLRSLSVFASFLGFLLQKDEVLMQPLNILPYSNDRNLIDTRSPWNLMQDEAGVQQLWLCKNRLSYLSVLARPYRASRALTSAQLQVGLTPPTLGFCPLSHLTLQVWTIWCLRFLVHCCIDFIEMASGAYKI